MSHPFEKILEKALKKSTVDDNLVQKEALKLIEKGYREDEICGVLLKLEKALIDDTEAQLVHEAREEVCEREDDDEEM
jgi:hypothetical protein